MAAAAIVKVRISRFSLHFCIEVVAGRLLTKFREGESIGLEIM
jgi:hypothetical protein